jgi:hypothetical protein
MQITDAAASKNIEKLVHRKLVKRKIVATNRRTTSVSLSESGEKIVKKFHSLQARKQLSAAESFNEQEHKQLSVLLEKYVHCCLKQEKNLDLICQQCTGNISTRCSLTRYNIKCRFQDNSEQLVKT